MVTMLSSFFACVSLCLAANAARSSHVVHERRELHGSPWTQRESADKELIVRARIALIQRNLENGHDWLMEVSEPHSPSYGMHYSAKQIAELFAPPDDAIQSVVKWLHTENVKNLRLSGNKQWLVFETQIGTLEQLLDTTYHEYENQHTGKLTVGCNNYSIPMHLKDHIEFVSPGLTMAETLHPNFARTKRNAKRGTGSHKRPPLRPTSTSPQSDATGQMHCDSTITPQCIKKLYNINDNITFTAGDGNSIGVYENAGDYLNQDELNTFLQTYEPAFPPNLYPKVNLVDGAPNPKKDGIQFTGTESAFDFQVVYPLAYPIPIEVFQVDDLHWEIDAPHGLFNTFLDYLDGSYCNKTAFGTTGDSPEFDAVYPDTNTQFREPPWMHPVQCGITKLPRVLSISYSFGEGFVSAAYSRRRCQEFMKLGMQGVSIFGASGDSGVADNADQCIGDAGEAFAPYDLTNCPYITAVGSTTLPSGAVAGKDPEIATNAFGSSGGFSNVYTAPKYQQKALATYFADHNPPYASYMTSNNPNATNVTGRYNRNGRGIPDVAAVGQNIITYVFGQWFLADGTSLSAPVWAGIVARINGARAAAGKGGIGFVNPALYAHPEVFTDIVMGDNPGCTTTGFSCVPGWDPVTGLGTPIYPKLKELFLKL